VHRLPLLVTSLVAALVAAPAAAQDCDRFRPAPFGTVTPSSSDYPVPTNSWLWYRVGNAWELEADPDMAWLSVLSLDDGSAVELEPAGTITGQEELLFAWQPVDDLEPLTDYEAAFDPAPFAGSGQPADEDLMRVSFRTGEQSDEAVPPVPTELGRELYTDYNQLGHGCEVTDYQDEASFFLESQGYFNLLGRAEDGFEVTDGLFARTSAISETAEVEIFGDIGPGARLSVRWSTVDLAGNFSGWSEETKDTMPAAGCVSVGDGRISQAALLPVGLLLLLGGWRRRRLLVRLGLPALLLCSTLVVASPGAAEASESVTFDDNPVELTWDGRLDAWLTVNIRSWGAVSAGTGGLEILLLSLQPVRPPYALQGALANTAQWVPTLTTFLSLVLVRQALRTSSPGRLRSGVKGLGIAMSVVATITWYTAAPLMVLAGQTDPAFSFAVLALPLSATFLAATMDVVKRRIDRERRVGARGRVQPQLLAAGPTGVVIAF